jgi:hypothetical protein
MNKATIVLILFLLTTNLFSQNSFEYGFCKFDFKNYEKENLEFKTIDSINDINKESINQLLKSFTGCFFTSIAFVKGQKIQSCSKYIYPNFKKYYNKSYDDPENFFYNLPAYELIYYFHDTVIKQDYCFNLYINNRSEIIGQLKFLHSDNKNCNLIDSEKAKSIVNDKWKNDSSDIYVKFGYYSKKNRFAWLLSRKIEGEHKGYIGTMQSFIIDAYNGKIIKQEKNKLLFE